MVLMGTRLDAEQQALLEELAALLNDLAKEHKQDKQGFPHHSTDKFVYVQQNWDSNVTHVITAATESSGFVLPSRTIKYFQGLLSSSWVVGIDWVVASICARKCVAEAEYLVQGDAKLDGGRPTFGAKRARANREKIFANQHFVLVLPFKPTMRKDVEQLIVMGGGEVREEFPKVVGGRSSRRASSSDMEAHASDIEEEEASQSSLTSPAKSRGAAAASPAAAAAASSSSSAAAAAAAAAALPGKWYLLSDDTAANTRAQLKKHVSPSLWNTCEQQHVAVVGVNWLFDSISAFKLRPLPA